MRFEGCLFCFVFLNRNARWQVSLRHVTSVLDFRKKPDCSLISCSSRFLKRHALSRSHLLGVSGKVHRLSTVFLSNNCPSVSVLSVWHVCLSVWPSCLYVCLSICLYVCLSACLPACISCLSVCLSVCTTFYLSVYLSVCTSCLFCLSVSDLAVYMSVCLSVCLSVWPSCLYVCLSACLT